MIKIALIDDHALFRIGLVSILKKHPEVFGVEEYSSFDLVKDLIPSWSIDIALVDISLGKDSGFDVVKYIKSSGSRTKVAILSGHKEEFYLVNAMEVGVDGYIHKDIDESELLSGVSKIHRGEKFYSMEISNLLINNIYNRPQRGLPFLTNKEKQVVKYLMDGFSSKEIAAKLNISPRTIETHRANVLSKFDLRNTTELIKRIVEQKIRF